jgi:hypothetical protein
MHEQTSTNTNKASGTTPSFAVYILLVLLAAVGAYVYTLRTESIMSCSGTGYGPDRYLAYCGATQYGDYDHGVFWLGLEPGVRDLAAGADVLFLGNSRMQFGFSSDAADQWFSAQNATHYLMGFAYWENYTFEWPLLKRINPRPKVYVINIDLFFDETVTGPAKTVMHDSDAYTHYRRKRLWQVPHRLICSRLPNICGANEAFYRSIKTGAYTRNGGDAIRFSIAYDSTVDKKIVADYTRLGREFLASIPGDHRCVLLATVPTESTK